MKTRVFRIIRDGFDRYRVEEQLATGWNRLATTEHEYTFRLLQEAEMFVAKVSKPDIVVRTIEVAI